MLRILIFLLLLTNIAFAQKKKSKKKETLITITTDLGTMRLILFDATPEHKANFIKLTKEGFYNGTTFHRIIDNFMIQGGDPLSKDQDPNNDGTGGPGYTIKAEFVPEFKHIRGAVAAARQGDQVNPEKRSSGSQFYIVENHKGTPFLDNAYTVFGQVIDGLDIIDKIAEQPKDARDRPKTDIKITITAEVLKTKKISKLYGYTFN
jgi:cyclophilin family peptidyl-prolyl cis-trans isomerase